MRGAQRSIANIWAVASRIKGYYGKRDLQTGERHDGPGGAGTRVGAGESEGAGQVRDQVSPRFAHLGVCGGGRLGFCFEGCRTGSVLGRPSPGRLGKERR